MDGPITSSIELEDFQPEDIPWLTFCQTPTFNSAKMEEVLKNITGSATRAYFLREGYVIGDFSVYPSQLNLTKTEYLNMVSVPLWSVLHSCFATRSTRNDLDSANCMMKKGESGKNHF